MTRKKTKRRKNNMLHITFRYRDEYSYPNWSEQECIVRSLRECKELYGLDECEYEIISIEEIPEH